MPATGVPAPGGAEARVAELAGQVASLQESVTTLSGCCSARRRRRVARPRGGTAGMGLPGQAARVSGAAAGPAWSRAAGSSHQETEERVLDVDAGQRRCAECGESAGV
jgi:hypothetical protein